MPTFLLLAPKIVGLRLKLGGLMARLVMFKLVLLPKSGLAIARLENQAGDFVRPNIEETNKALAKIEFNEDLTTNSIDDPEEGYPLVSLTWLMIYQKYPTEELLSINPKPCLNWILTDRTKI